MKRVYFFSPGESGWFDPNICGVMPDDAFEVDEQVYRALVDSGKGIVADAEGRPTFAELSFDELGERARAWRDAAISATEWLSARHRDEIDSARPTTLTAEQFAELLSYRQALRDWPESAAFPDQASRPSGPVWIAVQTK